MLVVFGWHLDGGDSNGLGCTAEEFPYFVSMVVAGAVSAKEMAPRRLVEHIKRLCNDPLFTAFISPRDEAGNHDQLELSTLL